MKSCAELYNLIEELIDGELDSKCAEQVNSHVFACPKCRAEYEKLGREKELFAQFLFDVEPAPDSWANFQARLAAENTESSGKTAPAGDPFRARVRGFINGLSPAWSAGVVILLIIFGIGAFWIKSSPNPQVGLKDTLATESKEFPTPPKPDESGRKAEVEAAPRNAHRKNVETSTKRDSIVGSGLPKAINKVSLRAKIPPRPPRPRFLAEPAAAANSNLETEIADQIEKIEMLLRSFRNAREIAGGIETFDLGYERTQARKLLGVNTRLRRDAETNGIVYAEELLSRVEPYLLEIANLEARPAPEKVLEIKERVNRQNIIASLQTY